MNPTDPIHSKLPCFYLSLSLFLLCFLYSISYRPYLPLFDVFVLSFSCSLYCLSFVDFSFFCPSCFLCVIFSFFMFIYLLIVFYFPFLRLFLSFFTTFPSLSFICLIFLPLLFLRFLFSTLCPLSFLSLSFPLYYFPSYSVFKFVFIISLLYLPVYNVYRFIHVFRKLVFLRSQPE